MILGRPHGAVHVAEVDAHQEAAGPEQAHDFVQRLGLVVDVVQHGDEQHAVGSAVGQRYAVGLGMHHLHAGAQRVVELGL